MKFYTICLIKKALVSIKYRCVLICHVRFEIPVTPLILKELLGIEVGETTKDGLFTLLEGECFGACADAPVLLLNNDQMHSWMDKAKCEKLISELKQEGWLKWAPLKFLQ